MKPVALKMKCALALVIGGILAAGPVMADKPSWAGAGKGGKDERMDRRDEQRGERRDDDERSRRDRDGPSAERRGHFEDRHRAIVREYYAEQFRGGRCPPGLAKKHNGCMPPGEAKKWQLGRPLPRDVIYYEVPQPLVVQIGPPPSGHRYVRVASDILVIAIGTGMVVDAIQDLGR
ncbi:MAG: hypothetical protein WA373_02185 [Burkholderiales bacterium]